MIPWIPLLLACIGQHGATSGELRSDGAFGFPQEAATVLCDTSDLRFSVCGDGTYLFAQAILWKDGDDALGSTDDGRKIGDRSSLSIDADADGKVTRDLDREYNLNCWPALPGLHYTVCFDGNSSSFLTGDSRGRGAMRYVDAGKDGERVRVDTYLIPLDELKCEPGHPLRFAFWAGSPAPELTVNSVGYVPPAGQRRYFSHDLARDTWHAFTPGGKDAARAFDVQRVPEGRESIVVTAKREPPRVGTSVGEAGGPPEISAGAWRNWSGDAPPTLASLRGKVIVVEFWATWCAPCVAGIPHLDALHEKHAREGLVILSLTDQERGPVEKFVAGKGDGMSYAVGMESSALEEYGVSGIPFAFVIGRDGTLLWSGHPSGAEFDGAIRDALKAE